MNKKEMIEIMMQVKENNLRLNRCTLHNFKPMDKPDRYKCTHCEGEADTSFVKGYHQGLRHNNIEEY